MEAGAQLEGSLILFDGQVVGSRGDVQVAHGGVGIRDPGRDRRGEFARGLALVLRGLLEGFARFLVAAQLVEGESPVDQGLDVSRIHFQRPVELLERRFRLTQEAQAQPGVVPDVGKARLLLQDAAEKLERQAVIPALERLQTLLLHLGDERFHATRKLGSRHRGRHRLRSRPRAGPAAPAAAPR